jgi:hypothetical protein
MYQTLLIYPTQTQDDLFLLEESVTSSASSAKLPDSVIFAAILRRWRTANICRRSFWIWWSMYFRDFLRIMSRILGSSLSRNKRSWWKLECTSDPTSPTSLDSTQFPLKGNPCLPRKIAFSNTLLRYARFVAVCFPCSFDINSATSFWFFPRISTHWLWKCER